MFLKKVVKKDRNGNLKYTHYRLCESYRIDNKVRARTIYHLGSLEDLNEHERKLLADRIEEIVHGFNNLLINSIPSKIERYAQHFSSLIIKSKSIDIPISNDKAHISDYIPVDINNIENREVREIGSEWIVRQTLDKFGVQDFLGSIGFDRRAIELSYINWISRTVHPGSELATENWLRRNSGLCELFDIDPHRINRFQLYKISRQLYRHKKELEVYFRDKTRSIFNLNEKIILYDLTNSYFEGRMQQSIKAKFGRSKEKRDDCKIITLALVTNSEGFIRYSKLYKGNISDCKTLGSTIEEINDAANLTVMPTIVLDAGIATEDNLDMLKENQYDYICISRSALKDYKLVDKHPLIIYDKNDQPIEIKTVIQGKNKDTYLYVKSKAKQQKETSIEEKLSGRFEEGLQGIAVSLTKKRGIKTVEKVYERIGRLKAKYPRVCNKYLIKTNQDQGKVTGIKWYIKEHGTNDNNEKGIYFIRTNKQDEQNKKVWDIYNTIREIESTFRCLKTELNIRPNFHQKDNNIEAHIHLGLLAYQVVSIIRYQLKKSGINDSWTRLLSKMNTQKSMTTSLKNKNQEKIHIRNCSIPDAELTEIYNILNLKKMPFYRKKA